MKLAALFSITSALLFQFYAPSASAGETVNERSEVIEAAGLTKEQIYDKARQWIAEDFVSKKAFIIDYGDKKVGTIILNGEVVTGKAGLIVDQLMTFTLRIDTKEGRFKVTTKIKERFQEDSSHPRYSTGNDPTSARNKEEVEAIQKFEEDLKKYVNSKASGKDDNW